MSKPTLSQIVEVAKQQGRLLELLKMVIIILCFVRRRLISLVI